MNPTKLFTLTPAQCELYKHQPDQYIGNNWDITSDEFERPPYLTDTSLRFWYNTDDLYYIDHWHNEPELIVPLENGYTVTVNENVYLLNPGDIILIPPGSLHTLKAPPSGSRFVFLYENDLIFQLSSFPKFRAYFSKPILITAQKCPEIYEKEISLVMQMASCYWSNNTAKQLYIYSCLLNFYATYADYRINNNTSSPNTDSALDLNTQHKLDTLLNYIKEHYTEKITLENAALKAHLSKFYFTRVFKQYTGQTFNNYLTELRIQAAEDMLKNTCISMSYISEACGFSSIPTFNRSFRKLKGCTPSEFRNLNIHEK